MSDRDKRLAELMGMCWHPLDDVVEVQKTIDRQAHCKCQLCGDEFLHKQAIPIHNRPDFSTPEWRAKLMDFCADTEWWDHFATWVYGTWVYGTVLISKDKVNPGSFITYFWLHLPDLVAEWRYMK